MAAWIMVLIIPIFLGSSVRARIETDDLEHCQKTRAMLVNQLEQHRGSFAPSGCVLGVKTVDGDVVVAGPVLPAWFFAVTIKDIKVRVEVDEASHCKRVLKVFMPMVDPAVPTPCLLGVATVVVP